MSSIGNLTIEIPNDLRIDNQRLGVLVTNGLRDAIKKYTIEELEQGFENCNKQYVIEAFAEMIVEQTIKFNIED